MGAQPGSVTPEHDQGGSVAVAGRTARTRAGTAAAAQCDFARNQVGPSRPREALLRRAGVADAKLHAARHTAGTMMVASGTDTRIVQEILGHTQITTTQIYVDMAQKVKREAVDRAVSALMDGNLAALLQRDAATERPNG
ncbi:tyrosine-type recombinase/integrase [Micromonospora profundi]|uniref:tyrosine-type recombinase/integrase n=1 Tax=Micromonospora profundi TaxID=1420889 RepID=UPI002FEEBDE5